MNAYQKIRLFFFAINAVPVVVINYSLIHFGLTPMSDPVTFVVVNLCLWTSHMVGYNEARSVGNLLGRLAALEALAELKVHLQQREAEEAATEQDKAA